MSRDMERIVKRLTSARYPTKGPTPEEMQKRQAAEEALELQNAELRRQKVIKLQNTIGSFLLAMAEADYPGAHLVPIHIKPTGLKILFAPDSRGYVKNGAGWRLGEVSKHESNPGQPGAPNSEYEVYIYHSLSLLINGKLVKARCEHYSGSFPRNDYYENPYYIPEARNSSDPFSRLEKAIPENLQRIAEQNSVAWDPDKDQEHLVS